MYSVVGLHMYGMARGFCHFSQEGFNPGNMRPWRLHWDHQLYKALEHQYQLGLEALNHLPEIKVDLIVR